MKVKTVGLALAILGIFYMVIDGWLISWWIVPDYRILGPAFLDSAESFYSGSSYFALWALSVPLGSIITAIGLAIFSKLEKERFVIFLIGSVVFLIWLAVWNQSVLYPVLYGVGGGIILFSFCVSIISLTELRKRSKAISKTALDLRAVSYIFFVITAWGMCGVLGIPSFGLRPEQLIEYSSHNILISMSAKVLVCFSLGWIFLALSQYMELRVQRNLTLD